MRRKFQKKLFRGVLEKKESRNSRTPIVFPKNLKKNPSKILVKKIIFRKIVESEHATLLKNELRNGFFKKLCLEFRITFW